MVSFSCEGCGDVLTKKKLDGHRNQCHGASFTCLDCMVHFQGTEYRSHTSCISEAQKYEGPLHKPKSKRKSVSISLPNEISKYAFVEDTADEPSSAIALVSAPPPVPSPPPSAPAQAINVFDFLVAEDTPNGSRISLASPQEQMRMVKDAPTIFKSLSSSPDDAGSRGEHFPDHFRANGYAYGAEPVSSSAAAFQTPAPKALARARPNHQHTSSTDKKRKRQVEELDLSRASRSSAELDEEMLDAEDAGPHRSGAQSAPVLHSGLTGGLNKLLSASHNFPPSPDLSGPDYEGWENDGRDYDSRRPDPSPLSPAKRTRYVVAASAAAGALAVAAADKRGRRRHLVAAGTGQGQLLKVRKVRRSSDESRPRKHRRGHGERSERGAERSERGIGRSARESAERTERGGGGERRPSGLRAIEYVPSSAAGAGAGLAAAADDDRSVSPTDHNQVVVYRSRAELFLSMVGKGPESEHGYSVNKALKRYHRERATSGTSRMEKGEEEKELWKGIRLKRNERGEVVLFVGDGGQG